VGLGGGPPDPDQAQDLDDEQDPLLGPGRGQQPPDGAKSSTSGVLLDQWEQEVNDPEPMMLTK